MRYDKNTKYISFNFQGILLYMQYFVKAAMNYELTLRTGQATLVLQNILSSG